MQKQLDLKLSESLQKKFIEARHVFYIDEAGNEFHKYKGGWAIITADGAVI